MGLLMGCTSTPPELRSDQRDPYEESNRSVFEFNLAVDDYVLEPVSEAYLATPEPVQASLTNFARWTSRPSTAVNSTLQGKLENGGLAAIDFVMNSLTLGLFDLTEEDIESEDFGQTLAVWGAPQGNYVVLPLIGQGTARSHTGTVVNSIINPLGYLGPTATNIRAVAAPTTVVTVRGNNYDQINSIKYSALDPYAQTRSLYFQYREGQIVDIDTETLSDSDKAFELFFDSN
jgi:phospholipid-binding lipoprotein MlaA